MAEKQSSTKIRFFLNITLSFLIFWSIPIYKQPPDNIRGSTAAAATAAAATPATITTKQQQQFAAITGEISADEKTAQLQWEHQQRYFNFFKDLQNWSL